LTGFIAYFGASMLLLIVFSYIYGKVTPYSELQLIREGNVAPAISYGGALFGFAVPVASAISHSVSFLDMMVWGGVAGLVQITLFVVLRFAMKDLVNGIADNRIAPATLLAVLSVAVGTLNAACMTC
jgi:putative membrane protein